MLIIYSLILRVTHKNGIYLFWERTFLDAYILVCSEKKNTWAAERAKYTEKNVIMKRILMTRET